MNLYEIDHEYREILRELYDDEGNVNEQALIKLENNQMTMEKKAIAIASFIKNMEAEREAIDTAKKAMAEREKRFKKRIDELEGYLLSNMERRGINHVSCPYFDIKLKKCPPSVEIVDESALPDEYKRTKIEVLPDKVKIKEEMKVGVLIPGAILKQGLRLEIR
jgi:hypothetical protein